MLIQFLQLFAEILIWILVASISVLVIYAIWCKITHHDFWVNWWEDEYIK